MKDGCIGIKLRIFIGRKNRRNDGIGVRKDCRVYDVDKCGWSKELQE